MKIVLAVSVLYATVLLVTVRVHGQETTAAPTTSNSNSGDKNSTSSGNDTTTSSGSNSTVNPTTSSGSNTTVNPTTSSGSNSTVNPTTSSGSNTTANPTTTQSSNSSVDADSMCEKLHGSNSVSGSIDSSNPCIVDCEVAMRRRTVNRRHFLPNLTSCGSGKVCFRRQCTSNNDDFSKACATHYSGSTYGRKLGRGCQVRCFTSSGLRQRQRMPDNTACNFNRRLVGVCRRGLCRRN